MGRPRMESLNFSESKVNIGGITCWMWLQALELFAGGWPQLKEALVDQIL